MKPIVNRMMLVIIMTGGLFIGVVKGQEARTKWVSKMKGRYDNKRMKPVINPDEVMLDDYEIASFHRN
jgi:hypothetical protein